MRCYDLYNNKFGIRQRVVFNLVIVKARHKPGF